MPNLVICIVTLRLSTVHSEEAVMAKANKKTHREGAEEAKKEEKKLKQEAKEQIKQEEEYLKLPAGGYQAGRHNW